MPSGGETHDLTETTVERPSLRVTSKSDVSTIACACAFTSEDQSEYERQQCRDRRIGRVYRPAGGGRRRRYLGESTAVVGQEVRAGRPGLVQVLEVVRGPWRDLHVRPGATGPGATGPGAHQAAWPCAAEDGQVPRRADGPAHRRARRFKVDSRAAVPAERPGVV